MHDKFKRLAKRLIATNGRPITLLNYPDGDGLGGLPTPESIGVIAVQIADAEENHAPRASSSVRFLFTLPNSVSLSLRSKIRDGDTTFAIHNIESVMPGDTVIAYKVQARR